MIFLLIETGAMVTAYHSSIYLRKISAVSIFLGGLSKAKNELCRKNGKLLLAALGNYILMNCYFLVRILTRMKPVNFVLYEILHAAGTRMALVVGCVLLTVFFCPGYDGVFRLYAGTEKFQGRSQRSREILKGNGQGGLTAGSIKPVSDPGAGPSLWGSYGDRRHTGNSFAKAYTATAVMATVSYRIEWMILFLGSVMAVVTDFGAMTVLYHQFGFTVPVPAKGI